MQQFDYENAEKRNLNRHIESVHKRIKAFNCNICNDPFTEKSSLKTHIQSVREGINGFKCDSCNYETKISYNL